MPKVAVILVPGIGGTHLEHPGKTVAWPVNYKGTMALKHLLGSSHDQAISMMYGSQFAIGGPRKKGPRKNPLDYGWDDYGWDDVSQDTYIAFLEDCNNQKNLPFTPVVWAAGYNWTQSNLNFNDILAITMQALQEPGVEDFIYVTHSMGSLIVRALLKTAQTTHPKVYNACIGVIHVAAPNDGAPEALLRFIIGYQGSWAVAQVMGDMGWKFTAALAPVQSMCELLPHHPNTGIKITGQPTVDPQYPSSTAPPYCLNLIAEANFENSPYSPIKKSYSEPRCKDPLMEGRWQQCKSLYKEFLIKKIEQNTGSARHFMQFIDGYVFRLTGAVCLIGSKTATRVEIKFNQNGKFTGYNSTYSEDGDGTVPLSSQAIYIDNRYLKTIKSDVDHGDAFTKAGKDAGIFEAVYSLMRQFVTG